MARGGRRRPGRAWPSPAAADPRRAPGAAGQTGSDTKGGSGRAAARWPTPANWTPCCCRRRGAADRHRELTGCCRPCRQPGAGTRERHGHRQRLDGPGRPAPSRAGLASPLQQIPGTLPRSAPGAHQVQLGSPDPVSGGDMATGRASMARGGRRCPGQTWPAPAAADPGHAPRERTRCSWANRIGHQRGKWASS